jgi:short-subunit dehydrogenase
VQGVALKRTGVKPVTLITGATGGIGSALARVLEDHELILLGRDAGKLENLCSSLPNATPVVLELKCPESFAAALEPFTRIDNLIHNAGMAELGSVQDTPLEVWRETFEVNLLACVELTRICLDRLRDARGQILFVNSGAGLQSNAGWSAYAASKFALRAFTDALDAEERPNGVRVMGIYPGRTATAMQEKVRAQEGAEYEPETYTKPESLAGTIKTMLETPRDSILTQVIVSRMG